MENIGVYRYIQQLISYITVFSVIVGRSRNTPRKSSPERKSPTNFIIENCTIIFSFLSPS